MGRTLNRAGVVLESCGMSSSACSKDSNADNSEGGLLEKMHIGLG